MLGALKNGEDEEDGGSKAREVVGCMLLSNHRTNH